MGKEREPTIKPAVKPVDKIKNLSSFRVFLFIVLAVGALAGCGYLMFYAQEQKTQQIVEQGLESATLTDSAQILAWRTNNIQEVVSWMNNPTFKSELSQFLASSNDSGLYSRIQAELGQQALKSAYQVSCCWTPTIWWH